MAESVRNPDVERRINEHLEAIDRALAAKGVPLTERRSVTGDVEAQIRDMLAASAGSSPTLADVEAILRKLDAPESYAEEAEGAPVEPASTAKTGSSGLSASGRLLMARLLVFGAVGTVGIAMRNPFIWGLALGLGVVTVVRSDWFAAPDDRAQPEFRALRTWLLKLGLVICAIGLPMGIALKIPYVWIMSTIGLVVASIKLARANRRPNP